MLRFGIVCLILAISTTPALAISELNKLWRDHYLNDKTPEEFAKAARKAGCNVCHVKGKEKKEVNNEYGNALKELVDAEDIKKRLKTEPEKVTEEVVAALKKAEEVKSKDGKTFGERMKAGELPATDAEL